MNDGLESGLRLRLRRAVQRTEGQHRQLRDLLERAEEAARSGAELRKPVRLLHDALRAHFELEQEVAFPALHGLAPASERALVELVEEHRAFLRELSGLFDDGAGGPAEILRFGASLREHERREEELLESIVGDAGARDV